MNSIYGGFMLKVISAILSGLLLRVGLTQMAANFDVVSGKASEAPLSQKPGSNGIIPQRKSFK